MRRKYNARCSRRLLGPMNRGGRPRVWRAQSVKCNYAAVAVCFMPLAAYTTAGKYRAKGVGGVKQESHTCRRRRLSRLPLPAPTSDTYGSRRRKSSLRRRRRRLLPIICVNFLFIHRVPHNTGATNGRLTEHRRPCSENT